MPAPYVKLIDYAPIVERVRTEAPVFKVVEFAATLEALKERGIPAMPAAALLPDVESPSKNKTAGGVHQQVRHTFFLYIFVKFAGDALGGKALDELLPLRQPIFDGLLAWQPPGADGVVEFAGGRREQLANGVLVWRDAFAFESPYRRIP